MYTAIASIKGEAPLSQSRMLVEKRDSSTEHGTDFEERIWRERLHTDKEGWVFIPQAELHQALVSAARHLGMKVEGKGKSTYTARFESGIFVPENIRLNKKAEDAEPVWINASATGEKGAKATKRVQRCYPLLHGWECKARIIVLDDLITPEVLKRHLEDLGMFGGFGRWRPQKGGYNGRFSLTKLDIEQGKGM